jgi:molecular chaperone DnaK (HSP70)
MRPHPGAELITAEVLFVSDVATIFIQSLIQSAQDYRGKRIRRVVITVPVAFTDAQRTKAATDAKHSESTWFFS